MFSYRWCIECGICRSFMDLFGLFDTSLDHVLAVGRVHTLSARHRRLLKLFGHIKTIWFVTDFLLDCSYILVCLGVITKLRKGRVRILHRTELGHRGHREFTCSDIRACSWTFLCLVLQSILVELFISTFSRVSRSEHLPDLGLLDLFNSSLGNGV